MHNAALHRWICHQENRQTTEKYRPKTTQRVAQTLPLCKRFQTFLKLVKHLRNTSNTAIYCQTIAQQPVLRNLLDSVWAPLGDESAGTEDAEWIDQDQINGKLSEKRYGTDGIILSQSFDRISSSCSNKCFNKKWKKFNYSSPKRLILIFFFTSSSDNPAKPKKKWGYRFENFV